MAGAPDDLRTAYFQLGEAIGELRRVRKDRFTQNDTNLSCFADADRAIIAADAALYRACQALGVPAVRVSDTSAGGEDGRSLGNGVLAARGLDHIRRLHVARAEVTSLFRLALQREPGLEPLSNALGPLLAGEQFEPGASAERTARIVAIVMPLAVLLVVAILCLLTAFAMSLAS